MPRLDSTRFFSFFSLSKLPRYLAGIVCLGSSDGTHTNPWQSHTTQPIRRSLAGSNVENSNQKCVWTGMKSKKSWKISVWHIYDAHNFEPPASSSPFRLLSHTLRSQSNSAAVQKCKYLLEYIYPLINYISTFTCWPEIWSSSDDGPIQSSQARELEPSHCGLFSIISLCSALSQLWPCKRLSIQ